MPAPTEHYRRGDEEEEEEDEEETADVTYKTVKDAVLFAIDVSKSMLQSTGNADAKANAQETATSVALKCAYALMQQRIISNPNDMMGIMLFGTEASKFQEEELLGSGTNSSQYPHCYLLADLDIPAAADVKRLRSLVQDEEESKELLTPCKEPVAMSSVLFCANQIFTTRAPNFSSRRLFLVTDNDNPHSASKELRSSAVVRAKDLYDLGVTIELFPISKSGQSFDRSKFYDDIVYSNTPSDPNAPAPLAVSAEPSEGKDGISLLNSLLNSISSRSVPRRALFSNIPLEFSPNFKISVKGFIVFKRQEPARSCFVWQQGETAQIAVGATSRMTEESARTVEKSEIRKAFKFGGENVTFTPEEVTGLKTYGDPVIRILGFKPQSMLPEWARLKTSTFIYPSEDDFVGSTRTFSALQQTLLEKEKMAIVWFIARKNAAPFIAALLPGREKFSEYGEQQMPAGLWIVPLPFADDIRQNPEGGFVLQSPDDLTDKMRTIIQNLQLPKAVYDPSRYPNPSLQWHYQILQAIALEDDVPEKPDDKTIPKYKQIHKRVGQYVLDWGAALDETFGTWQREHKGLKREQEFDQPPAKKPKASASVTASIDDAEIKKRINDDTLSKFTVAQLKQILTSKDQSPSGTKAVLVDRVAQFFETMKL